VTSRTGPPSGGVPAFVRRLGVVSFFTDVASEMIYPLLPALLASFGTAPLWLGAMEGVAEAVSAIVKVQVGPLTDRARRRKPLVVAGYAVATLVRPLISLATAGAHVVLLRALDRVGKGVRGVPRDAMIADGVEPRDLAKAYSLHRAMDNAGSVLGPMLAFALLHFGGVPLRAVIGLAVLPGLVSLGTLVFAVHEPRRASLPSPGPLHESRGGPTSRRLPSSVRRYLVALAMFSLASSADSFLLLRATDLGLAPAWVPILWLCLSASKAASNVPGGRIADSLGRVPTLAIAWSLYAVFYVTLAFVATPLAFSAVVVAYGTYYGLSEGAEKAILAERAPPELRGRAFGTMHAITGLAVLPANVGFGLVYQANARLAFLAIAALALASVLVLIAFAGRDAPGKSVTGRC